MKEIEPHPDLIRYFEKTSEFRTTLNVDHFFEKGEHYNIVSDVESNIYLLSRLDSVGLLRRENSVCDCGLGLGNALFDIYLQSLELKHSFSFHGIEKQKEYVDFVSRNLEQLWAGKLNLVHGDIMEQDYSAHNIVYTYSPFNNKKDLTRLYEKISSEITKGSVMIEHTNDGLGHSFGQERHLLEAIDCLKPVRIDWQTVFVKV